MISFVHQLFLLRLLEQRVANVVFHPSDLLFLLELTIVAWTSSETTVTRYTSTIMIRNNTYFLMPRVATKLSGATLQRYLGST